MKCFTRTRKTRVIDFKWKSSTRGLYFCKSFRFSNGILICTNHEQNLIQGWDMLNYYFLFCSKYWLRTSKGISRIFTFFWFNLFFPMYPFFIPWKRQKTMRYRKGALGTNWLSPNISRCEIAGMESRKWVKIAVCGLINISITKESGKTVGISFCYSAVI